MGASIVTGDLYGWFVYQYAQIFGDSDLALRASSVVPESSNPTCGRVRRNYYNEGTVFLLLHFFLFPFMELDTAKFRAYVSYFLDLVCGLFDIQKSIEINLKFRWTIICLLVPLLLFIILRPWQSFS